MNIEIQKHNIPALRFPKFSGEWKEGCLGILSDVRDGTHDSPKFKEEGYPLVTSKNLLKDGSLDFKNTNLISESDFLEINKRSKVDVGDILFGMIGTIGNPILLLRDDFAIKNVALIKEKNTLTNLFLIHYLKGKSIQRQFYSNNTGGTQKFLALGVIRNLNVSYPKDPEEELQIALFLSSVDERLSQLGKKKKLLEQYKKGMMQKLFSQQIRFKDDNGNNYPDWEEKRLGEIFDISAGGDVHKLNFSKKKTDQFNIPVYANTLHNFGLHGYTDKPKIIDNAVTITGRGDVGHAEARLTPFVPVVRLLVLLPKYEVSVLFFKSSINAMNILVESTGVPQLTAPQISRYKISFPSLQEQTKIANLLTSIDDKINLIETELTKAKTFKKGLLQQMFI